MSTPEKMIWNLGRSGSWKTDILPQACPKCSKQALTLLPDPILRRQPDKTNVVCHPNLGGCNHGFELDGFPTNNKPPKRKREPRGSYQPRSKG